MILYHSMFQRLDCIALQHDFEKIGLVGKKAFSPESIPREQDLYKKN